MSQQNRKGQLLEHQQEEKEDNGNELREVKFKMAALEAKNYELCESLAKMKQENGSLEEKLREAEEKAQMAKNELEEFVMKSRQKEEELANLIAVLKERRRIPLPLELNCQIFECLKFGIQRKFIGGLGRGIYAIFRQKVLTKSKRLRNPEQNGWKVSNTGAIISSNGLLARDKTGINQHIYAKKGFPISGELSRTDNFPGTILHYFEVTIKSYMQLVGLSGGNIPENSLVGDSPNSYAIRCRCDYCYLSGKLYHFEWPDGVIKPKRNDKGDDVYGCGILLHPGNELSIFFTRDGLLMGKPIPINTKEHLLYPTVYIYGYGSVEANFGDDSAKPFKYNIKKCPGLGFE